ncbi:MAG: GatB/YqeY domain-containing protein [Chitinophagaceae bacterium]
MSSDTELKLLQKIVKQRKGALEIYQQQHRADLAQKEQEEINLIEKFLPAPLSEEELKNELQQIITETGASSTADIGKVMSVATKKLAGSADGKTISATAKQLLSK